MGVVVVVGVGVRGVLLSPPFTVPVVVLGVALGVEGSGAIDIYGGESGFVDLTDVVSCDARGSVVPDYTVVHGGPVVVLSLITVEDSSGDGTLGIMPDVVVSNDLVSEAIVLLSLLEEHGISVRAAVGVRVLSLLDFRGPCGRQVERVRRSANLLSGKTCLIRKHSSASGFCVETVSRGHERCCRGSRILTRPFVVVTVNPAFLDVLELLKVLLLEERELVLKLPHSLVSIGLDD